MLSLCVRLSVLDSEWGRRKREIRVTAVNPRLWGQKFDVSTSTYYKDMKDDTKCRKWHGLG